MKLPKRDKTDKPKPVKPAKGAAGAKPKYFWDVWLEKRRKAKMPKRESSIPAKPTSKEDKMKLIAAAAIVVLVPLAWLIFNAVSSSRQKAADDAAALQNKRR
jgi:hypothetical protein